ncbi:MAG: protein translocase subunit SecD [Acidimicrobiia bacterium]|nr:protein translocase subunit SecD [Acidimicrobiia bacterium]
MRRHVMFLVGTLVVVASALTATIVSGTTPVLGLDLQGGISVVLAPVGDASSDSLDVSVDIIRSRVDALGVAEPEISRQGGNIVVDLPGVKDRDKARRLVGQTAELRFRPVLEILPPEGATVTTPEETTTTVPGDTATTVPGDTATTAPGDTTTVPTGTTAVPTETTAAPTETTAAPTDTTTTTSALVPGAEVPTTPREEDLADAEVVLPARPEDDVPALRYRMGPAALLGGDVDTARAELNPVRNEWSVTLVLTGDGLEKFNELAAASYPQPPPQNAVAIVLDSQVISAPAFQTPSFDGDVAITGDFSETEARDLASILKFGALPVALEELTTQNVSPTLGKDQLRAGIVAGLIGLGLVTVYMILYYRVLGLVVLLGLGVAAAALYSLTAYLGESIGLTLTLAGVTGLVVSVGIAVDSYIVYFERLKDELRTGKTVRSSLERGFRRSWRTILAADLVSLIGAGILYWLAVGSVRGFAFFLGLSTLLDLFISYFFMHPLVSIIARPSVVRARWIGVAAGLDVKGVER